MQSTLTPPQVSTVVLTGAGFSVPAGLPVTSQLIPIARKRARADILKALDARARALLGQRIVKDVEAVLTRLKVLELYSYSSRNALKEIRPLRLAIYALIAAILRSSTNPPGPYDAFLDHLGNDVAFASLNYDLLLETILRRRQRPWHYVLQGLVNFDNDLRYRENFYEPLDRNPRSISYLKLHGSFNWQSCWRCGYLRIATDEWFGAFGFDLFQPGGDPLFVSHLLLCDSDRCGNRSRPGTGQALLEPLIIPPTLMKDYSQALVRRLWTYFDNLLRQAKQIILVGTSLRREDVLLLHCLSHLKFKTSNLRRLVVIDPKERMKGRVYALTEVKPEWYPSLDAYIAH
jgi:hypothetical protein